MRKLLVKTICKLGRIRWIVDSDGDVGFSLFGIPVICYKWNDSAIIGLEDITYRLANKRELCSREYVES